MVYDVKVTGYESITANSEEAALEVFRMHMERGYKVSDLRWKVVEVQRLDEDE